MNRAAKSIRDQELAMEQERKTWARFSELVEAGNLVTFWREYAEYLERNRIISRHRETLHRAARETAKKLGG